jgi:hypothetical protein
MLGLHHKPLIQTIPKGDCLFAGYRARAMSLSFPKSEPQAALVVAERYAPVLTEFN